MSKQNTTLDGVNINNDFNLKEYIKCKKEDYMLKKYSIA